MTLKNKRILVIDDDNEIWKSYKAVLAPEKKNSSTKKLAGLLGLDEDSDSDAKSEMDIEYDLRFAPQGRDGFEMISESLDADAPFALAFIDVRMPPGWDGLKTSTRIRRIDPDIEIVIVTAYSDRSPEEFVQNVGSPEKLLFIRKPFDPGELTQLALSLTEKWSLGRQKEEQRDELETVLMTSPAAIFSVDSNRRVLSWNPAAERITGYAAEDMIGNPCAFPEIGGGQACAKCLLKAERPSADRVEIVIRDRGGARRILSKNASFIRDHTGKIRKIVESFWDITELKKVQNYVQNVINSMPSILVTVDSDGRVVECNSEAEKSLGKLLVALRGKKIGDVLPRMISHERDILKALESKSPVKKEKHVVQEKDGIHFKDIVIYPLTVDGAEGAVIRVDDVTSRVRLEEMMIQSEKMLTVGGLAAGMAHEINNPLAGILQNLQVMVNRFSPNMRKNQRTAQECGATMESLACYMENRGILKMIDSVMNSGKRAARVVENMLSFSRKSESHFAPCDLGSLMDQTIELARNDYDLKKNFDFRRIEIKREYDPDTPPAPCEHTKIQQVILNLLKNASQAMTSVEERTEPPRITLRVNADENMARIEVEDNGPGMEEDVRKRIFEPFYTTKEVGIGTGLGLSVSYFIITENHDGAMTVESSPGRGSNFIIQLPLQRPV
ncbi:MAG: PAS domain S-box protein [Desulfobacterales bacterium]|nr:PAS domain S-box protein [Desulfobacterales bacterium]